jgi:DNA repair exonuclease SbcCD ATPase subunit
LRDRLAADRHALEAFGERMATFRAQVPGLDAAFAQLAGRLSKVDEATRQAVRLEALALEIDAQLTRLTARQPLVEALDTRVNALHLVSADIDRKMSEQLARRADLDGIRTSAEGLSAQMADAQEKLDAIHGLQHAVLPMADQLTQLRASLDEAVARAQEARQEEAAVLEQRARLEQLLEENRAARRQDG